MSRTELRSAIVRRVRYSVAMSLDGFIADRDGGYDWIVDEPDIDFAAYLKKIDTLVMGRGTYETAQSAPGGLSHFEGMRIYVVSTTLDPDDVSDATVIAGDAEAAVRALKEKAPAGSRDIWLFGGGVLFRSLLEAGLVDRVEVGVVPVLLGEGIPLLPGFDPGTEASGPATGASGPATGASGDATEGLGPAGAGGGVARLALHSAETFDSGMVLLKYDVVTL